MRKGLAVSFVVLGVTSLAAQVLVIRELLFSFFGNEFFIGWTLFAWLFWVAAGVFLAGRWGGGKEGPGRRVAACHAGAALILPLATALIRGGRTWTGAGVGAVPDLLSAMGFSIAALAPLCLVLGAQFVLGVRAGLSRGAGGEPGRVQGLAYAHETAGLVAGGLVFSLVWAVRSEFEVAGWLAVLNVLAGVAVSAGEGRRPLWLRAGLAAGLAAGAGLLGGGGMLDRATGAWRFPGQVLVETRNTIYGNLAVTAIDRQYNFHGNGLLLGAADEPMAGETVVHYPMLGHAAPRRVLLMGGGYSGALQEILRHAPDRVDYLELDPMLIGLARNYTAPAGRAALEDPRVKTHFTDGRYFLRRGAEEGVYDVVVVNLSSPATALLNRFYSREFYRDVRRRLARGGVLAVRLDFSPDYLGRELETLGASIDRTLREEFAQVRLLAGYELLFLASVEPVLPTAVGEWVERYEARGLETAFVIPPAIAERLESDRNEQVEAALAANTVAQVNRDGRPVACHYHLVHWLRSFHPRAAAWAARMGGLDWRAGAAMAGLVLLGMGGSLRGQRVRRAGAWAMGVGSFTLMASELALLMAYQSFCGYLYYNLARLLAVLMLGMAVGTAWATRRIGRTGVRTLAGVHALLAIYVLGLAAFIHVSGEFAVGSSAGMEGAYLLLAALAGGLVGYEFPVANRIHLGGEGQADRKSGVIYAVDLAGSCLGALLVGLWALPVMGTTATLVLLAGLNGGVAGGLAGIKHGDQK